MDTRDVFFSLLSEAHERCCEISSHHGHRRRASSREADPLDTIEIWRGGILSSAQGR
jgi:hypothetical protein